MQTATILPQFLSILAAYLYFSINLLKRVNDTITFEATINGTRGIICALLESPGVKEFNEGGFDRANFAKNL